MHYGYPHIVSKLSYLTVQQRFYESRLWKQYLRAKNLFYFIYAIYVRTDICYRCVPPFGQRLHLNVWIFRFKLLFDFGPTIIYWIFSKGLFGGSLIREVKLTSRKFWKSYRTWGWIARLHKQYANTYRYVHHRSFFSLLSFSNL